MLQQKHNYSVMCKARTKVLSLVVDFMFSVVSKPLTAFFLTIKAIFWLTVRTTA